MDSDKTYQLIEDYLRGKLSEEEKSAFERRLATDESLAFDLEMARLEHDSMELMLEQDLRKHMQDWAGKSSPPPKGRNWIWLLLASLVLATFLILFFRKGPDTSPQETKGPLEEKFEPGPKSGDEMNQEIKTESEKEKPLEKKVLPDRKDIPIAKTESKNESAPNYLALAESAYQRPEFGSTLKSGGQIEPSVLDKAALALDRGNFSEAIRWMESFDGENKTEANSILGHAWFGEKDYNKAAEYFQKNESSFRKKYEAEWFHLLCLLAAKGGKDSAFLAKAGQILENSDHPYNEQTRKLMERIEKNNF